MVTTKNNILDKYPETIFEDTKFMTGKEKFLVLKDFEKFVKGGFKEKNFTKRLYHHLHLHCGFIAHHNRSGFYHTYFNSTEEIRGFFNTLDHTYNLEYAYKDYRLLLTAMIEVARVYHNNGGVFDIRGGNDDQ